MARIQSPADPMPSVADSRPKRSGIALVAIGVFKLVKCALLGGLGIALVHWRNQDLGDVASHWINVLSVGRPFLESIISKLSSIDERTLREVAAGSFIYSALLLIEGIGLCLRKRWAEFLTVGITGSLLPIEFYEVFHHLTTARVLITLVNIAIVWYLVIQLLHDRNH
jgi:uncharacterized membrane protein (DUF2068 family)